MRRFRLGFAPTLCIGLLSGGSAGAAPAIEHQPLRCIVAGMHPWVQAAAPGAVAVQARFRLLDARQWYGVRLTEDEDGWVGALPRPKASLRGFVYYLEATDASATTARTAEHSVRVVASESACGTEGVSQSVSDADVLAETPAGRPGLPKGFDGPRQEPAGGKIGVFSFSPRTSALVALGLGGTAAGIAAALGSGEPRTSRVELVWSDPPPGSTISLASFALSVRVRLRSSRDVAAGSVVLGLRPVGYAGWCVTLFGAHPALSPDAGVEVTLDRLMPFLPCTSPFTTQQAQVTVRGPDETDAFGNDLPISYSFVP